MHCPKCGHQQAANEVKYCSRCGFYLGLVAELLLIDGALPGRDVVLSKPPRTARKKKIRQGAKVIYFSAVLFIITLVVSLASETPEFLLLPLIVFVAGLFWIFYHLLFTDEKEGAVRFPVQQQGPPHRPMLRPEDNRMRVADPRNVNTADMQHQPSVTDHTTQLFDKDR